MEGRAFDEVERIRETVRRYVPRRSERRLYSAVLVDAGQALIDVLVDDVVDRGERVDRRVETRRLDRHSKFEVGAGSSDGDADEAQSEGEGGDGSPQGHGGTPCWLAPL